MFQNHTKDTNNNCKKSLLSDRKSRFDGLEREIRAEFQNLHRFLDEEEYKDLERLRRERQKQVKQLKEREKKIAEQGKDLERAITVLNSKLAEEDSSKLLKVVTLSSIIQSLHSSHFVRAGLRSVSSFQQRWIRRSALASLWGPFNITSMSFDPETAHPNLSLSQSCTSVWFEEDKDTKDCQPNPRRFHYYYCVFGNQRFTTGRHYWEVEVGCKTAWRLGVAREDISRGEMATTGTSGGFWTLALKGGVIMACTDPKPTKVNVSVRLVRIGVFLDCDEEEVSFYNAVTMAPIYTFTMGTVLAPLLPFYNPCDTDDGKNTAALKIFSPSL
ncbi:hypothetical protein PAMP_002925 [Pampus punctatissimus]